VSAQLQVGERVVLIDRKERRYLQTLNADGEFHTHKGVIKHADMIGGLEGDRFTSSGNEHYLVLRPTLSDFVLEMPRGAQVIYPKDIGPMLMLADIGPGVRVFESGVGSGALSMAMLRAGAIITGYDIREDFANRARNNVRAFLGEAALTNYDVHIRDAYEGAALDDFDRMVLDLPEPWHLIASAVAGALRPGGTFLAYTPTIVQAAQTKHALDAAGFAATGTTEVLQRGWHIEGQSVRPDHRMVAHTGFLTFGRRTLGRPGRIADEVESDGVESSSVESNGVESSEATSNVTDDA
jgi:tRNA (adenine57-N1/adenine58-N1)-methyltransferase catalytic subunit